MVVGDGGERGVSEEDRQLMVQHWPQDREFPWERTRVTVTSRSMRLLQLTQHGLFALVLIIAVVRGVDGDRPVMTVVMALVLACWYIPGVVLMLRGSLRPDHGRHGTAQPGAPGSGPVQHGFAKSGVFVWLSGLSIMTLVAIVFSRDFAWVSFALFLLCATSLPPVAAYWSIGMIAIATGSILTVLWPGQGHPVAQFIGPVIGALVAAALVSVYLMAETENRDRQELIDLLIATQDDLARANLAAGVRSERERVAAEIHDTLAQGFASTVLLGRQALVALGQNDVDSVGATLRSLVDVGSAGLDDARRLVRDLPPRELDDVDLGDAIELLLVRLADHHGVDAAGRVVLRIDGDARPLTPQIDRAVLRVVQEAVNNALAHSRAEHVVVTLTHGPEGVNVDIVDDGVGFDPASAVSTGGGGFGLGGMAARMASVGGTFSIESEPGRGTVLAVSVPSDADADTDAARG